MNNDKLKDLNKRLWDTADELRANTGLKASEYSTPILGLIFLKFADSKYEQYEESINKEYQDLKGGRREKPIEEIAIEKCGFYLPKESRYDYLLNLSEEEDIAKNIKEAIEGIEKHSPELVGILPKDSYHNLSKEDNNKILNRLLRNFNDIPTDIENDIFGEIYEYFLGNFALKEGQGGGEFFTPRTVVQYMVEVLKPTEGKILDPACGSGKTFTTVNWLLNTGVANGYRILWLVHRQELINQTYYEFINQLGDLKDYGIKSLNIMPISGSPEHCKMSQTSRQDINICSIYSVASKNGMRFIRRMLGKPGERKLIVVIDEAHHAIMPSYKKVLDRIDKINPNRILLGLTATPIRMSEQETVKLNKLFKAKEYLDREREEIKYKYIYEIALGQLIKTGFLSKPYYKYIQTEIKGDIEFDLSNEEIDFFNRFGELTEDLKRRLANSQSRNEIILQEYLNNKEKYGKTLIFAINQLHAKKLNELFTEAGIRTDYAISNRKDSQDVIRDFKGNEFDVLINVQMLTEGTDVPNIQTVFLTRETNSDSLLMQMVGRGLRGVGAGGTENAYIISFHDKWEKIRFWMKPEFVTEGVKYEDESIKGIKDPIKSVGEDIVDKDIEIVDDANIRDLLEKLYDVMKVNIISDVNTDIIPDGWYTVFDEENEIDVNITVYDDQVLGYQLLEDSTELIIDGKLNLNNVIINLFKDSQVKPDIKDIQLIIEYIKEEYKMPEYYTFEHRNKFDPKLIANKMIEEVDEEKHYEYWLKDYYDKTQY